RPSAPARRPDRKRRRKSLKKRKTGSEKAGCETDRMGKRNLVRQQPVTTTRHARKAGARPILRAQPDVARRGAGVSEISDLFEHGAGTERWLRQPTDRTNANRLPTRRR